MLPRRTPSPSPPPLEPLVRQLMLKPERSRWVQYSVAILLVLLALLLLLLLDRWVPMHRSPFLLFFAAVMVSAWYGGMGTGLCAMTLATGITYVLLPPAFTLAPKNPSDLVKLGLFVLISLLVISLSATRRQLVRALRHERDLMAAIVGTAGSLIVVCDRWGRIIQFNRACEKLTGCTFADVRGNYIWDLFLLAEEIDPVKQVFQNMGAGILSSEAVPSEHENYWLSRDGKRHLIAWSNNVLLNEWGAVGCVISAGLDITERKQAERSLQEANQALQALIQASPVAITVLDRRGIVKRWNPAAEQIFGWQAEAVLDRIMPTVPPEKQAEFFANIAATLNGDVLNGMETYRQRQDGTLIYVGIWTAVLHGFTAEDDCILSIVVDLSARKQAETELELSQERLYSLVEANVIGILFGDINGGISEANDEFLRTVGYSREDLQSGSLQWTKITPEEYLPLDAKGIKEALAGKDCIPYEKEYIRKDGSRVPVLIGFGLLGEARQQTIAFILDLTERKQLEQTLRTQTDELAQANRMKDEFLAVLSHELRTPLNSIMGWATLLQTHQFDTATTARALETMERNARLQNQLINDILDVSKITQGQLQLQLHPVDLTTVVTAALETMRPAAVAKSIAVRRLETMPPTALIVLGDPDRLQQVIWNLLSNAIKFTPEGGQVDVQLSIVYGKAEGRGQAAEGRGQAAGGRGQAAGGNVVDSTSEVGVGNVRKRQEAEGRGQAAADGRQEADFGVSAQSNEGKGQASQSASRREAGVSHHALAAVNPIPSKHQPSATPHVHITVTDTGKGINAAFLPFVFDRFRQADSSSTRTEGGLGLGLAIVRHLVELHGGTVHAHSPGIGEGASFVFALPLMSGNTARSNGLGSGDVHELSHSLTPASQTNRFSMGVETSHESFALSGLQILLVDDEPDTRAFLQTAMTHYGAIVTVAASAAEALSLLTQPDTVSRWKPDVLVSDIGMPDEDGYTLIRKVRALGIAQGTFLPALALTAYVTDEDRHQALTSGFQMHLAKPIEPGAVVQAVLELVDRTGVQ